MYFIPRNNAIYNYIAHTSLKRCYLATLFLLSAFFVIGMYSVYFPLRTHVVLLQSEKIRLQSNYNELAQLDKNFKELSNDVASSKKNIADRVIMPSKQEEDCHKRMLFVLETIATSGLALNAYGSCKEKDKEWYIKNSAHCDITGPMQKIMMFLEAMKNVRTMTTLSHVTMTRVAGDTFQMSFDVGLVTVKKSLQL